MKKVTSKRLLTLVLVVVFIFALSVSAFATWSSFQKNKENNGTATTAVTNPTSKSVLNLSTNGYAYSGVDTTPVIQGNNAYTLYNGGVTNGSAGGARLSSVNLASGTENWNIQLDATASNANQLSTPYYDSDSNMIYAAVTYETLINSYSSLAGWTASGGASISNGMATFTAANQSVSTTITLGNYDTDDEHTSVSTIYLPTDLALNNLNSSVNYTVTLSDGTNTYTLASGTKIKDNDHLWAGTYDTYNSNPISYGTYTLTVTVNSITGGNASLSTISFTRYDWHLFSIGSLTSASPTVSSILAYGEGQINTPINTGKHYIFFGAYGGDHSYYQYGPIPNAQVSGTPTLTLFTTPYQEDYYLAGSARVGDYVVFGSESGRVYKRPIGDDFGYKTVGDQGYVIDLNNIVGAPGPVRSSVCFDDNSGTTNDYLYLTSQNGFLWKINPSFAGTPNMIDLKDYSYIDFTTSTPVVSDNGYIYVGGYHYETDPNTGWMIYYGAIKCVPISFNSSQLRFVWTQNGEAVQSSIVSYSTTYFDEELQDEFAIDYLYFTSNGDTGAGYCISYVPDLNAEHDIWNTSNVGTGYTLQGVAVSDSGTVVFGNDDSEFYIVK